MFSNSPWELLLLGAHPRLILPAGSFLQLTSAELMITLAHALLNAARFLANDDQSG